MALKEYQLLYLDNDIPINRSFYCNNGDVKSRGLEVHVLDNSQAKDCTGLTLRMIIKVPSGDIFEATVANGLVTVLNAASGIYQILFPDNMGRGRLIAEIQLSNAVPEVIVSRKFSIVGDGSLTSDGVISLTPQGGMLWNVLTNETQRQADFVEVLGSLDEEVALKYAELETEYATDLTGVKSQLAEKASVTEARMKAVKIALEDMSADALGAIAGTGTFNLLSIPQDLSVEAKKLDRELSDNIDNLESLFFESLYSTFEKRIVPATDDFSTGAITGFLAPSNVATTYDTVADKITFDASSQGVPVGTVTELFIKNSDFEKVRNGFTLDFDIFTPMTLGHINIWVYAVKGTTINQIYADVITNPIANQVYNFNRFYDGLSIPSDTDAIRVYINIDGCTVVSTKLIMVQYFNMLIGKVSTGKIYLQKASAKAKMIDSLGFNDVIANINTVLPIQKQLTSGLLTTDMCESVYAVPTISGGILSATFDTIKRSILFPVENKEITFRHIVDDDWILIGGDNVNFTTLAIGTHNIYIADYINSGANISNIITDINILDVPVIGDIINLKWVGTVLVAKKNKNDGNGFVDWFTINTVNYPLIVNWGTKRFGAVTYLNTLMGNVDFTPLGLVNVIDTLNSNQSSRFINKKCNFVGDSITFREQYQPIVANTLGLAYTPNYGVSSSTVAVNNVYLQAQSAVERIVNCLDADMWILLSGVNDWLYNTPMGDINSVDTATFCGALKAICVNVLGRNNRPKLILCTPLQSNRNGANGATPSHTMLDFCNAIKEVGQYYSVPVLDLYSMGGINPLNLMYYTEDGVHPTLTEGMPLLANSMIKAINAL